MQPPLCSLDPARCPLCGTANGCAMKTARPADGAPFTCWCMAVDFDAALRDSVPAEARGLACICARCAAKSQA